MASFSLFSYASDTILVNVSGASEGSMVRIQVYLASDPTQEVTGFEVPYTGYLISETVYGLFPNTAYLVEVYVDNNQIGSKTITTQPAEPAEFRCSNVTKDSVTVIVTGVVYGDSVGFAVYLASDTFSPEIEFTIPVDGASVSRIISGLQSGTSYSVEVYVNGNSIGSETITTLGSSVTPPTPPPSTSPSFNCVSNTYDSVSVSVTGIKSGDIVRLYGYLAGGSNTDVFDYTDYATGSSLSKTFSGLDAETVYCVEVYINDSLLGTKTVTTQAAPEPPSFDCVSNTYDTITVTVIHAPIGSSIRFIGFLASDPSSSLFEMTVRASSATVSRTFNKLRELTEYIVDVYVDDDWLGRQTVQTKKKPNIINGRIVKLPILRPDYPLFSWDDWPNSRDALIAEGEAKHFEKEAWNDIIDTLSATLTDSEISWDNFYTSADEAKITEQYGDLYAKAFNSIRYNVNKTISLPWAWAVDPNFHGHIGREDFRGYDQYGEDGADDVYSTYFLELTRRLNLFIEILRGTADTPNAAVGYHDVRCLSHGYGNSRLAANGILSDESRTRFDMYIYSREAALARPEYQLIPVPFNILGRTGYRARAILDKTIARTLDHANVQAFRHVYADIVASSALTTYAAYSRYTSVINTSGKDISSTIVEPFKLISSETLSTRISDISTTEYKPSELVAGESRTMFSEHISTTQHHISGYTKMMSEYGIRYRGFSSISTLARSRDATGFTGLSISLSKCYSTSQSIEALGTFGNGKGISDSSITGSTGRRLEVVASDKGTSDSFAISTPVETLTVSGGSSASSNKVVNIDKSYRARIEPTGTSSTSCKLTIGDVWLLPSRLDDGSLWIRQAYETTQSDNILDIV